MLLTLVTGYSYLTKILGQATSTNSVLKTITQKEPHIMVEAFVRQDLLYFFTYRTLFLNLASVNIPKYICGFIVFIIYSYTFHFMTIIVITGNPIYPEAVEFSGF